MKHVTLEQAKTNLDAYVEEAQSEDIVVTRGGKPVMILSAMTQEDLDDYKFENDPRFTEIMQNRRERYLKEGGISIEEVVKNLGLEDELRKRGKVRKQKARRKSS